MAALSHVLFGMPEVKFSLLFCLPLSLSFFSFCVCLYVYVSHTHTHTHTNAHAHLHTFTSTLTRTELPETSTHHYFKCMPCATFPQASPEFKFSLLFFLPLSLHLKRLCWCLNEYLYLCMYVRMYECIHDRSLLSQQIFPAYILFWLCIADLKTQYSNTSS